MLRKIYLLAITGVMFFLMACGGNKATLPGAGAPLPDETVSGLPSLMDLPVPDHSPSILGPGWYEVDLGDPSQVHQSHKCDPVPGGLALDGSEGISYAIFTVHEFTTDCFPTSVRLGVDSLDGEYYIGFSDYIRGSWAYSGPFTGGAEAEIPNIDAYSQHDALVSDRGVSYVAVVIEEGCSLVMDSLAIGIHGGDDCPLPPTLPPGPYSGAHTGDENGLFLQYQHSASYSEADFNGYYIERAPGTWGSFTRLNATPVATDHYLDETAVLDEYYRYRVAATDASGNLSSWYNCLGMARAGTDLAPVAVVEFPGGPLTGPVEVTFDMSGSFDPDGDPITTYRLDLGIFTQAYDGTEDHATIRLEPGCYTVECEVETATRSDQTIRYLKIYPAWEAAPEVVAEPEPLWPRSYQYRVAHNPSTGRLVTFWVDLANLGIMALEEGREPRRLPLIYSGTSYLGEPVVTPEQVLLPVQVDEYAGIASYSSSGFTYQTPMSLEVAGNYVEGCMSRPGIYDMLIVEDEIFGDLNLSFIVGGGAVVLDVDADLRFDCAWNPVDETVSLVYTDDGKTYVKTLDLTVPSGSMQELFGNLVDTLDLEFNHLTGKMCAVFHYDGDLYYVEQNADDSWPAPEDINPAADESAMFDLFTSGLGVFMMYTEPGSPMQFAQLGSGSWVTQLTFEYDGVLSGAVVAGAFAPDGSVGFADMDADLFGHFSKLDTDLIYTDYYTIGKTELIGLDLCATTDSDFMHAAWVDANGVEHYTCYLDEDEWDHESTRPGSYQPGLMADSDGFICLSHVNGGTAFLDNWDGFGWVNLDSTPVSSNTRPLVTSQPIGTELMWLVNNSDVSPSEVHFSDIDEGVPTGHDFDAEVPTIWTGTVNFTNGNAKILALAHGTRIGASSTGTYTLWSGTLDRIFFTPSLSIIESALLRAKLVDSSAFRRKGTNSESEVFWAAFGPDWVPARITCNSELNYITTDLLDPSELDRMSDTGQDIRFSVTAGLAAGTTAVGLASSLDGGYSYLEWDNWGNFEELPLPDGLESMSTPELIVDGRGRWHILYRHLNNGTIYCWSTVR